MLKSSVAPHLRRAEHPFYQAGGVLLCVLPLTAFSCIYYGIRPALLVLSGLISAVLVDLLCSVFRQKKPSLSDGTSAVTGALIGCMMGPMTSYWVPMMGAAFAIGVVKMPFGGTGRNVFNPAAAGVAFCAICFPERMFHFYPDPSVQQTLPLWGINPDVGNVVLAESPTALLANNARTTLGWFSLLSGRFPGPIASAGVLVLLAAALFLFVRGSSSPLITLPYLMTCALFAAVFPRAGLSAGDSMLLELCVGLLLFTGVFLLCDPVTAPRHWLARIVYGVLGGVLVMLLRYYGRFDCSEFFAVLLVNALSPLLDRTCWRLCYKLAEVRNR